MAGEDMNGQEQRANGLSCLGVANAGVRRNKVADDEGAGGCGAKLSSKSADLFANKATTKVLNVKLATLRRKKVFKCSKEESRSNSRFDLRPPPPANSQNVPCKAAAPSTRSSLPATQHSVSNQGDLGSFKTHRRLQFRPRRVECKERRQFVECAEQAAKLRQSVAVTEKVQRSDRSETQKRCDSLTHRRVGCSPLQHLPRWLDGEHTRSSLEIIPEADYQQHGTGAGSTGDMLVTVR
mmetsp:Transcript_19168/g.38759  ORF Transcript_19168/g.38759 Transcript_19168/m.38759 type:complete len:238 (-) Transcript_19168:136-849(-)